MDLLSRIQRIHDGCSKLCQDFLGSILPVAGNIGIFCQSDQEFEDYTKIRKELAYPSDNPNQKYFELKHPIRIGVPTENISETYTHLYIRKPNPSSPEEGDVDFLMSPEEYSSFKQKVLAGESDKGASIYSRPGWDMVELRNPAINALAYVCTREMAEKVRVRFD